MKISIFLDVDLNRNGVGSYFNDLAKFYIEKKNEVKIYNSEGDSKIISSIKFPNDKTQKIYIPNYFDVKRDILKNRPNLIFISFYGPFSFIGARMAKKMGIPYIYVINNDIKKLVNHYNPGFYGFLLKYMRSQVEKNLINKAMNVVIVNPKLKNIPYVYSPKSVVTMSTLIDSTFINRKKPDPVTKINSVLYYGRLAIEKNLKLVFDSAKNLPHLTFNIAGDGPLKNKVIDVAKNLKNLNFLGWVDRSEIIEIIEKNDMVVMPSSFETFGTVALESLSRGRIVIIGEDHGIREFKILNKCLFNFSDFNSLSNAIKTIAKFDANKISDISKKSYDAVQAYNIEAKQMWIDLIKNVN